MVKIERRLLIDATLFGVLLTLLVAAADALGLLTPLERWLYDQRALLCQHWTPPPTDRLVHVDIDDPSVDAIGAWPWKRSDFAEILDEIGLAGPKAVALDVLFSEPQKPEGKLDPDAELAKAIRRLGNCVVAASFPFRRQEVSPVFTAARDALYADAELSEAQVTDALRSKGLNQPDLPARVHDEFPVARRQAMYLRIRAEGARPGEVELEKKVLPHADKLLQTAAVNAFRTAYTRSEAADALARLALPVSPQGATILSPTLKDAPLAPFSRAAAAVGFVDYPQFTDGKVRGVPLLLSCDGRVYPQFGLALAWRLLDADPAGLRIEGDAVIIPRGSLGDLRVPVRTFRANELLGVSEDVPLAVSASWFGRYESWETMYDAPQHRVPRQHLPLTALWDAVQVQRRIISNNHDAELWMRNIQPDSLPDNYFTSIPYDDVAAYSKRIEDFLPRVELPAPDAPDRADFVDQIAKIKAVHEANPTLLGILNQHRQNLRAILAGKAVLVGWTSTGAIADFLPTSLHPRCPGVVLHGVMFNQIMTGEVWRTLPRWATHLVTLGVGVLATLGVSFLSPFRALLAAAGLIAAYLAVNGYLLFDYGNLVLGAAGPVVAVGAVYSGGTLAKLAVERWERARITRRFSSYVDPKLVEYVLAHPDQAHFEGQVREMSVAFCDVAGFTRLTETRGSETVTILNELWGVVVPAIKQHGGLINKFMGDGIMFFFGAPEQSPNHARDAVTTVLAVRKAVERFNAEIAPPRRWPALELRCGVSTGNMVVGDAGYTTSAAETRADYTVLGDNVNLGSRLEAANKAVGTRALVTERTYELSKDAGVLFRPVGKLCVVGKQTGVMTYEPIARLDDATGQQKSLAAATQAVVDAFIAGRLQDCLSAIERMEAAHGPGKLTALYRERCEWFLGDPSRAPFDCQIVLTEK